MKNLPRYTLEQSISCGKPIANFKLDPEGRWVNFSDIKDVLKPSYNQHYGKICPSCKSGMWRQEIKSGKCWNCGSYIDATGKLRQ